MKRFLPRPSDSDETQVAPRFRQRPFRRLFAVPIAVVFVLAACGPAEAPATPDPANGEPPTPDPANGEPAVDEIRIGLLFPTTGAFGFLGTDQANGVKMVLEWANEQGGINGVPIQIFEADSQSDAGVGATEAQRLIDQHDVHIIIGSYASGISHATSPVAERNGVIYWEIGAVATDLSDQGYQYFLRTVGDAATYAQADVEFLMDFMAPELGMEPEEVRIAVAHENGPFGSSVADALHDLADEHNLNIVITEPYPSDSTDLTPLVLRLQDAEPDVLFIVPLPPDTLLFWEQARAQDFNVSAVIGSAGFSSPSFIERFGAEGIEGAMVVEAPAVAHMNTEGLEPEVGALLEQMLAQFHDEYGHDCLVHCGDGFGGAHILVTDVLPRAVSEHGSVDADAIREAANGTDIPDGGTLQGFGARFIPVGEDNAGDNERARSYIMQWHDGVLNVVWPPELAVAEPQFPMPTWDERE